MDPSKKASGAVPTDKLKLASNAFCREITYHSNNAIDTNTFPDILKLPDVTPIFRKGYKSMKENFRPISLLSSLLTSMKGCYGNNFTTIPKFKNLLCAFRECHSPQHALTRLVEQCRKSLDDRGIVGMVLMDLSKAFDCIPHELPIPKLEVLGMIWE